MNISDILLKPQITEKSSQSNSAGKYTFFANKHANKIEIKKAFESLYGIKAEAVNIINSPSKIRLGKNRHEIKKRAALKKAIITTQDKKTIDFNKFKD